MVFIWKHIVRMNKNSFVYTFSWMRTEAHLGEFISQSNGLYVTTIRISNLMLSSNMIFGTSTHIGFGLTKLVNLEEI